MWKKTSKGEAHHDESKAAPCQAVVALQRAINKQKENQQYKHVFAKFAIFFIFSLLSFTLVAIGNKGNKGDNWFPVPPLLLCDGGDVSVLGMVTQPVWRMWYMQNRIEKEGIFHSQCPHVIEEWSSQKKKTPERKEKKNPILKKRLPNRIGTDQVTKSLSWCSLQPWYPQFPPPTRCCESEKMCTWTRHLNE